MKILHIENSPEDAELVRETLDAEWPGCGVTVVSQKPDCLAELTRGDYDLILSDFSMGSFNGLDALALARELSPETPFIFLSGTIGEDRAIEAVRSGAADYIIKDRTKRLVSAIQRALRENKERKERRKAEIRIHEQAEVLNQAQDAILITDLEDRFIFWNTSAERIFGWKSGDVLGKTAADIFAEEVPAEIRAASEETRAHGEWRGELHLHNQEGQAIVVEARRSLIHDESGKPKGHLVIVIDITEKKRMEEQLLRVQRTENIGLLAAGIAHDLNNVLAPILMAAPMLRERATDPSDIKMLTMLEKSAERGAALVRQILAFAHGVSGERKLVQVKHVMTEIAGVIAETFPKSVRFEYHIPSDLWPIKANLTQIHQVLLNLCINARDAMPQGGVLGLRGENCQLDEKTVEKIPEGRTGSYIAFEVKDTGTGIAPEVLERMWEPFFTTKGSGRGTGLGLSTVRSIVENHGGFMEVETAPGQGSRFRVFLPAAIAPAAATRTPSAAAAALKRGNGELVLVVDDESSVREVATAILSTGGYRVLSAGDGAEAMAIFAQHVNRIALVISDMQMPNFNGAVLARVLHRIDPSLKIIAMSGQSVGASPGSEAEGPQFGSIFLRKPFTVEDLLGKVHELISPTP